MGGVDEEFQKKAEEMEEELVNDHGQELRREIPGMLKDPRLKPYMKDLVKIYKEGDLLDNFEAKYFEGNVKISELEEEMKRIKDKKISRRILGGNLITRGNGLDKPALLAQVDFTGNMFDPISILLNLKKNPMGERNEEDIQDSLTLL